MVKVPVSQGFGVRTAPTTGARYAPTQREMVAPASGVPGIVSQVMANFAAVQEKRDQVKVSDQLLQARAKMLELQREALETRGSGVLEKDGQTFQQTFSAKWDEAMSGFEANMTDSQKKLFKPRMDALRVDFDDIVARHEIIETDKYETLTAKSSLQLELDAVSKNYKNDNAVDTGIRNSMEAFRTIARNSGWAEGDPNWVAAEKEAVADFHAAVLGGALDAKDTGYAREYLAQYGQDLDAKTRKKAEELIQKQDSAEIVDRESESIWAQYGPKSDTDPVQLDRMMAEVRKVKDPETRKLLEADIKGRASSHDYSVGQRQSALESGLYQKIESGVGLRQLRNDPSFLQLDGKTQSSVIDRWEAEQKERQGQGDGVPANAGLTYFNLIEDPERLRRMSIEDIWALTPVLGKTYRDSALRRRQSLLEETPKGGRVKTDLNLLTTAYRQAKNISPGTKLNTNHKTELAALELEMNRIAEASGHQFDYNESVRLANDLMKPVVVSDRFLGYGTIEKPLFQAIRDVPTSYVSYVRTQVIAENKRRAESLDGRKLQPLPMPTDEQIVEAYRRDRASGLVE